MYHYSLNLGKMKNKIIYISLIIFSICIIVVLCWWRYVGTGLSEKTPFSEDTIYNLHPPCDTSADSVIILPVIQKMFLSSALIAVDTTIIFSASDIAYSDFTALYLDTVTRNIKSNHVIFREYCFKMSKDSLEYFGSRQMRRLPRELDGHASPISITLYLKRSPYKIKDNIIYVQDYRIKILNDYKLEVIDFPKIPSGTICYCTTRFYPDSKKLKYRGTWVEGKQHGEWMYVDEEKNIIFEIYENDKFIKRERFRKYDPVYFQKYTFGWIRWPSDEEK